jgi:hypothetical protein
MFSSIPISLNKARRRLPRGLVFCGSLLTASRRISRTSSSMLRPCHVIATSRPCCRFAGLRGRLPPDALDLPRLPADCGECARQTGLRTARCARGFQRPGRVNIAMSAFGGAREVRRDHGSGVTTVLPSVRLTQFQAGNRGNRIPLVSWLERASEQAAFRE